MMHCAAVQQSQEQQIQYIPWDLKRFAKLRGGHILAEISPHIKHSLSQTKLFICAPSSYTSEEGKALGKLVGCSNGNV